MGWGAVPPSPYLGSAPEQTPMSKVERTPNSSTPSNPRADRTPAAKVERTPTSTPAHQRPDRTPASTPGGPRGPREERIFVTVRIRPMNTRELSMKEQVAWECADDSTILFKASSLERSNSPASYTFDRVFGPTCLTETVYENGAKDVALSALTGINATIFAYGQTSSGKTFTMKGITESAVRDIYDHIAGYPDRNFVIKISAMEIYNEVVRDLLKPDTGPLRLLDDPEKGVVIEKLEEEIVKDSRHLTQLIGICEAQRQVGETSLNDKSSRSHQIIKLTIESCVSETSGCVKSFVASLNFVDLAGNERISQTQTEGTRLKEGCHINRSLLTLTTVIRKLSTGKKGGHIPYRDSKLTRILQLSLGGNSRTAIICTMSPAFTHVEQSRNTLSFATRAKEVTNKAQVNMVISDKQLLKHLQKEVARLEAELRTPEHPRSSCSDALLVEKEMQIKKMELEMQELKRERDQAQFQLNELRQKVNGDHQPPGWNPFESPRRAVNKCLTYSANEVAKRSCRTLRSTIRQSTTSPLMLVHEIRKLEHLQQQLGDEANNALEVLQKEVACHRQGNQDAAETIAKLQAEIRQMCTRRALSKSSEVEDIVSTQNRSANLKEEITRLHTQGSTIAHLEMQLEKVQKSLDKLVLALPNHSQSNEATTTPKSSKTPSKKKKILPLSLSSTINRQNLIRSPCSPHSSSAIPVTDIENKAPDNDEAFRETAACGSETNTPIKTEENGDVSSREGTPYRHSSSVNVKKIKKMVQNAAEENARSIKAYVTELKERVAKLQYQKQLLVCQVLELEEANEASVHDCAADDDETVTDLNSPAVWEEMFREQRKHIFHLWDVCHVSIIHRTQFYLLFKGDTADQIYVEVELRRLAWLQQHFVEAGNESPAQSGDVESIVSLASSIKALRHEREFLSKRMNSRLSEEEREILYNKWQIPINAKQRRLQLACKLWTDPNDPVHIEESAQVVARLVGFGEGSHISKEMFELNFALPVDKKPWLLGWNPIANLLRM